MKAGTISCVLLTRQVEESWLQTKTTVAIDVLRATSVMAAAVNAGVERIQTFGDVEETRAYPMTRDQTEHWLRCGERHCKKIDGFDLGNSPADYTPERVQGRSMAMTTTNGTQAFAAATASEFLFAGAFVNYSATLQAVAKHDEILLWCAGTDGFESAEDILLAGGLIRGLLDNGRHWDLDDAASLALGSWNQCFGDRTPDRVTKPELKRRLRQSRGGKNLVRVGMENDLATCADVDRDPVVVRRTSGTLAEFTRLD